MIGEINIKIDGISFQETERYREIIHTLLLNNVLNIRNGHAIIHFDHEGILQEIELHTKKWRRNKPPIPFTEVLKNAKVEVM